MSSITLHTKGYVSLVVDHGTTKIECDNIEVADIEDIILKLCADDLMKLANSKAYQILTKCKELKGEN